MSPRGKAEQLRFHLRRWEVEGGAVDIAKSYFYRFVRALTRPLSQRGGTMPVDGGVDDLSTTRRRRSEGKK